MADVKWIKITTDMFDNRKIKYLRTLPDGDRIVLIWVMLLTLAGRCNAGGMIFLTENVPYTTKMLADELDFDENIVVLALKAFEKLNMIQNDGFLSVSGWDEYQSADKLDQIRQQNRLRKQRQRERERELLLSGHATVTGHEGDSHAIEEDIELDIDKEIEEDKDNKGRIDYQSIADLFNGICVSYPKVTRLSQRRKDAIKARFKDYSLEDFKEMFEKAEASDFLKGHNDKKWAANFDWLIKDANMAKVMDGNYDNRGMNDGSTGTDGEAVKSKWNLRADVG